jgi:hypothetical protein
MIADRYSPDIHMLKKVTIDSKIDSPEVRFATGFVMGRLDAANEQRLFGAIAERALLGEDQAFSQSYLKWLQTDGATVILRDELCRPYQDTFDDQKREGFQNNAWFNAFTGIDSAKLGYREEFRVGMFSENAPSVETEEETYTGLRI